MLAIRRERKGSYYIGLYILYMCINVQTEHGSIIFGKMGFHEFVYVGGRTYLYLIHFQNSVNSAGS